jgi:hypothetical protein
MSARKIVSTLVCLALVAAFVPAQVGAGTEAEARSDGLGCPSTLPNPEHIKVWILVTHWCGLGAVRGQAQFKIQVQLHNDSPHNLNISQSRMRLVVSEFSLDKWSPPRLGEATTDRPIRTTYGGETVWAIPANANNAFDPLPHQPGVGTFATHWDQSVLAPGETSPTGFHVGDLVFYAPALPHDPHYHDALSNVVGIAYVKGRDIIGLCPREGWKHHARAETF